MKAASVSAGPSTYSGNFSQYTETYLRDGVVVIRNVIDEDDMKLLETVFHQRLREPTTTARLYPEDETIVQSHGVSIDDPDIERLIRDSAIADVAWGLFGGGDVWYWTEQAWLKEGGNARRTPWHQDTSYLPFEGDQFVNFWIPLDPLPAVNVLEVVRGSHRTTLYNGTIFAPDDDTAPLYDERDMPRLPDIESERHKWDIFSSNLDRGDILALHPGCLHGGAPTFAGQRRRAMSFRFFGNNLLYRPLPKIRDEQGATTQSERKDKLVPGVENLKPGDPIYRSRAYRRIRPWSGQPHVRHELLTQGTAGH